MPAWVIILAGVSSIGVLVAIPALVLATQLRSSSSSKLQTALALLLWFFISIVHAGVWFIVAVAAHKVDDSLTMSWIIANAAYPLIGVGIILTHHYLLRRRGTSGSVAS